MEVPASKGAGMSHKKQIERPHTVSFSDQEIEVIVVGLEAVQDSNAFIGIESGERLCASLIRHLRKIQREDNHGTRRRRGP